MVDPRFQISFGEFCWKGRRIKLIRIDESRVRARRERFASQGFSIRGICAKNFGADSY